MNGYMEDIESLLDGVESDEFEERTRRRRPGTIRTPSRQSSFVPRSTPAPATQGQVQAAARSIDSKIETLTGAVKALETRTTGLSAEQDRLGAAVRKEVEERKKAVDATRADIQQTKLLAAVLPLVTQTTKDATDASGNPVKVVTKSDNQLATLLPLLLLMSPGSSDGGKGPMGGDNTMMLLLVVLLAGQNR